MRKIIIVVAAVATLTAAGNLRAGEATATLRVSASVVANCRVEVQPLEFAPYDPLLAHATSDLHAQTEVRLLCTRNIPATIELDGGTFGGGTRARALAWSGDRLRYGLFMDSARLRVWGIGSDALVLSGTERALSTDPLRLTIYGTIPQGQEVSAGEYLDLITARVHF